MLGKMEIRTPPGSRPRDGRHCDLCGCSQPAVRCDKCGCQIFCLSCDDMYHRHPKRRFHLRKAVDPTPPVPQARPVLPMKVAHLSTASPGDPSKMPLPPPRKKKSSLFGSFRKPSPSSDNSPPLPKKEYSWTDRLGSIKKFMSNRPLPPLPTTEDDDDQMQPTTNGQSPSGDLSFIHRKTDDRPPQLPQRSPRSPDFPGNNIEKENRIPTSPGQMPSQVRNGSMEPNANHMNQNVEFHNNEENQWNHMNNQNGPQRFGTLQRPNQQRGFGPPGMPGYPGGMHQSSSATDLHSLQNVEGMPGPGQVPPHFPQHYPMNPHMPPHYPYPMYPQYPNYPQYFGNSFANLSNPPTSEGDFSDNSETPSRHSSKKHPFRKRAKRSQSVMMDRMAYPGQFYPFGPYPGYGPWGAPMPMEAPPSPASSIRSLNRSGRNRRRKKMTSEDDDEEFSMSSSPVSRPKSSSSDPKETGRAPLATQTTSSEEESDGEMNNRKMKLNTIQRRQSDPPGTASPAVEPKGLARLKKSSSKQSDSDVPEVPEPQLERRPSRDSSTEQQQQPPAPPQKPATPSEPPDTWECKHCTFANPMGNRICQVCCKTFSPSRTDTPVTAAASNSRPGSAAASGSRKQSVGSEQGCSSPEKFHDVEEESVASRKDRQDMASLNSALDEAEKQISKGLEELMKLKDDIDANMSKEKGKGADNPPTPSESREASKPVYKSSGRMRTSILDKLNLNKPQTSNASISTSTETQTGQGSGWTSDKIIEPSRRHSNSSTTSETYNSPLAQSPDLERAYLANRQKRDSSCQTQQQDSLAEFLERKRAAEEAFLGRPINNFGFDRMDMVTSPVPPMYDRYFGGGGGGYGMMQRSHSRASLFTGRMNDFGPMDYGGGFGYGPSPMYRSSSRSSLTGDYPDGRMSEFHNLRKPDFYLSMEELVERRRQENIRAQGLELVRMIREAEQQGFNADDIQVALSHCGKQNPMEWLQENWRNMVDSVVTLSTNYGNDKKDNDIGLLSENEARDALRLHKGNIWAAVTECVEGRQRKYLELSARGNFLRNDIVDALTASDGDVEMAYAKLTKNTGKPFLMRIWGAGEGAQNQDGARPLPEDMDDLPNRYLKDETLNSDELSEEIWSEDGDWEEDEDMYGDERTGDIEELQTCREDLHAGPQDVKTPESDSEYCDPFPVDDRNASSPSDDIFFVIPEAKPEKKRGFLSKLSALRRDSKEQADTQTSGVTKTDEPEAISQSKEDTVSQNSASSSEQAKNNGALNALKSTLTAIKDTVTGAGTKNEKKLPCAQPERRTIIVRGQLDHESLSTDSKEGVRLTSIKRLETDALPTPDLENKVAETNKQDSTPIDESSNTNKEPNTLLSKKEVKLGDSEATLKTNLQAQPAMSDNVPKPVESKQTTEPKKPQSLAERLKFAKQYRSSTNVSAIQKETSQPVVLGAISGGSKDSKNEPLNGENTTAKQKEQLNIKPNDNAVSQFSKDTPLFTEKESRLVNATESRKPSPIQQNISKDIKAHSEKPSSPSIDLPQTSSTVSPENVPNESKLTSKPEPSKADMKLSKPDDSKTNFASESKPSVMSSETTDKKEVSKKVVENTEAGTSSIDSKQKVDMHQNVSSPSLIKDESKIIKKTEEFDNNSLGKTKTFANSKKLTIESNASSNLAKQKDVLKKEMPQSQSSMTSSKIKESNENENSIIEVAPQTSSEEAQKDSNTKQVENIKDIPNSLVDSQSGGMTNTIPETSKKEASGSNSGNSTDTVKEEIISNADKVCAVAENQDISQKSAAILDHSKSQPTEGTASSNKDDSTISSKQTLSEEASKVDKQDTPTATESVIKEVETIEKLHDGKQEHVTGDSSTSDLPKAQIEIAQDVSPNRVDDQNIKAPDLSEIQNVTTNVVVEQPNENTNIQQKPNTATSGETTLETQQFNREVSGVVIENKTEPEKSLPISTATEEKTLPIAVQESSTNKDESVTVQNSIQSTEAKPLEEKPKEVQMSPTSPDNSQKNEATVHKEGEISAASSEDKNASQSKDAIDNTKAGKFKFSKSGKVKKTQAKEDKKDSIKNKDKTVAETASTSSLNKSLNAESGTDIKPSSSQSNVDAKADSLPSATSKEKIEEKISEEISEEKVPKEIEAEASPKQPVNEMTGTETENKTIKTEIKLATQQEKDLPLPTKSPEPQTSGVSTKETENNSKPTESQISAPSKDFSTPSSSTDLKTDTVKISNTPESDNQKANILTSTNSNSGNVIEKLTTPEVELQQPVVSKEYPGKKTIDGPSSPSTSVSSSSTTNAASSSTEKATVIKEEVKDSVSTDAPKQDSQHSKTQETVVTDTSTSGTNSTPTSKNSVFPTEKKQETRTADADYKSPQTQDSDDTDIEYSDESRPSSVTPPSPVDALRSRFEGLAGGATVRGQTRPQSPFRRMSLNSRKQVIALERKRDITEKPWYHQKITPEPVKTNIPKRTIRQQLEMERRVRQMVSDRKVRTYRKAEIVVSLMDMNFEEDEAIQAASECSTLEQAISYLQQECLLCAGHYPVSQIVSMTHCEHRACRDCIRAYFTVQIRDRTILDLLCPFCNEPDIGDEDVAQDYFNHLDIMLKKLVDMEIHELFQRKLRDRVLMKDPNFRWCSQCSSGFIAMPNLKRLVCPDCNAVTCASCRRLWEREHQGISCEAFAALKDASDPEAQAAGLAKMLTEDGIDCPSCHFRYALAKGGCMHFRCIQCQHDFCSGCSRPFKMGQKCGVSEFCAKLGLHAHHPRNCLFYLRDKEPEDLQKLLEMNDVSYNRDAPDGKELSNICQVMEQKETADGMVDDYCGKEIQDGYAGLCRVHYVEYLGQLVNKHKVDPIQIFDNDDLELVLRRANIRLPPKRYRENEAQYREKLVNVIQEELPLDKMDGS